MIYVIKDWAGNTCFNGERFKSFDDAEEYLSIELDEKYDTDRGEYEITFDRYEVLDTEEYFDQAEAAYTVCVLWHGGQASLLYELQCRIDFIPGMAWSESEVEENNYHYPEFFKDGKPDESKLELFVEELEHYFEEREHE